jgi:hypothetical protein
LNENGTAMITVVVTDEDGATNSASFVVTVLPVNDPPQIAAMPPLTVTEMEALNLHIEANDPEAPPQTLEFELINPPPGMAINSSTGGILWTPSEVQGPGNYEIAVVVRDNGSPSLSATQTVQFTVLEANQAPELDPVADQMVHAGSVLRIVVTATDDDLPANSLSYSISNAPSGAVINSMTGEFIWNTDQAMANTTNTIAVMVQDNGAPVLSDLLEFDVIVASPPKVTSITLSNGTATVTWTAIAGIRYQMQFSAALEPPAWADLDGEILATGPTASHTVTLQNSRGFFRIAVIADD